MSENRTLRVLGKDELRCDIVTDEQARSAASSELMQEGSYRDKSAISARAGAIRDMSMSAGQ